MQLFPEPAEIAQANLIDAAVAAGIKRIAPSEWSSRTFTNVPFYSNKLAHRHQLERLSQTHDFEYSLFQPGILLESFAAPHQTTAHLDAMMTIHDLAGCRAMVVDGHEDDAEAGLSVTSVLDMGKAMSAMVDLPFGGDGTEGVRWPKIGGIFGNKLSVRQILDMQECVLGKFSYSFYEGRQ